MFGRKRKLDGVHDETSAEATSNAAAREEAARARAERLAQVAAAREAEGDKAKAAGAAARPASQARAYASDRVAVTYKDAGVDTQEGARAVAAIRASVRSTYRPEVIGDIGGFGGLFAPDMAGMKEPVLVSGTDGVGTKQRIAQLMDRHDTVGIDCVAMCVNDIICCGTKLLFLLDSIACG